jgi:hypothetical protein
MMSNKEMFEYRMDICKACSVFNSTTRTCGNALSKLNPFNEWQEMNGVRFKPCGCFMDVKARMALQECPAKLWTAVTDTDTIEEAKELIATIKKSGVVTGEQRSILGRLKAIINGETKPLKLRHCIGCVTKIVDELNAQLKREETEVIEVEQPQPKKRGRKRRTL